MLRHPGYNVAYWNLPHRKISRDGAGQYLVNGEPLKFFHFSGFDPKLPSLISKHQSRLSWGDIGKAAQSLYLGYEAKLTANGYRETSAWPYAYAAFGNGVRIPDCFRSYFHKQLAGKLAPGTDVFGAADGAVTLLNVFQSPVYGGPLTVGAMAVYHHYPDLKAAFPNVPGKDARPYAHWFARAGDGDARIEPVFVEPVRRRAGRGARSNSPLGAPVSPPRRGHIRRIVARGAKTLISYARRQRNLVNRFPPRLRGKVRDLLVKLSHSGLRPQPAAQPIGAGFEWQSLEPGINVFGLLDSPTGVGEAARGNVACFERLGIPLHRIAFDEQHLFYEKALPAEPDAKLAINCCHVNADCSERLQYVFGRQHFKGRFNIGCWEWELEEFPSTWDAANFYDEIWVPTAFVQQAVAARMRVPVVRIPHCVQIGKLPGNGREAFNLPQDRPVILCMFDTASIVARKNPMAAIEAVERACLAGQDPILVHQGRPDRSAARTGWPPPQTIQTRRVSNRRGLAQPPADPEPDRRVRHVPLAAPIRGVRPDPRRSDGPGKTGSGHRLFGKHGFHEPNELLPGELQNDDPEGDARALSARGLLGRARR